MTAHSVSRVPKNKFVKYVNLQVWLIFCISKKPIFVQYSVLFFIEVTIIERAEKANQVFITCQEELEALYRSTASMYVSQICCLLHIKHLRCHSVQCIVRYHQIDTILKFLYELIVYDPPASCLHQRSAQ